MDENTFPSVRFKLYPFLFSLFSVEIFECLIFWGVNLWKDEPSSWTWTNFLLYFIFLKSVQNYIPCTPLHHLSSLTFPASPPCPVHEWMNFLSSSIVPEFFFFLFLCLGDTFLLLCFLFPRQIALSFNVLILGNPAWSASVSLLCPSCWMWTTLHQMGAKAC